MHVPVTACLGCRLQAGYVMVLASWMKYQLLLTQACCTAGKDRRGSKAPDGAN